MARFYVESVFELPGMGNLVLAGTVLEGRISPGMKVRARSGVDDVELTIEGIEFIDHVSGRCSAVGLRLSLAQARAHRLDGDECWSGKEFECT